jgi:hypothetical protein
MNLVHVLRRQECAQVMVKPPGDSRRSGVLEIDNSVFIAGEIGFVEESPGLMNQSGELKFRLGVNAFAVKTREQCGRCRTVETFSVIKDANFHQAS